MIGIYESDSNLRVKLHRDRAAFNLTDRNSGLTLRRVVAGVAGMCALCLTVGVMQPPCSVASGAMGSAAGVSTSAARHAGPNHELPVQSSNERIPCKTAPTSCCVAMTACGLGIALESRTAATSFPAGTRITHPLRLAGPLGTIPAPEPPPPKI